MKIVIDTSAILAVILNEKSKESILSSTEGCNLIAPESLDAEIGNALSAMFKRNRINLEQAQKIIQQYEVIPVRRTALELEKSIQLCDKMEIYAYDAYMINCCLKHNAPLLSLDKSLLNNARNMGINTLEI